MSYSIQASVVVLDEFLDVWWEVFVWIQVDSSESLSDGICSRMCTYSSTIERLNSWEELA